MTTGYLGATPLMSTLGPSLPQASGDWSRWPQAPLEKSRTSVLPICHVAGLSFLARPLLWSVVRVPGLVPAPGHPSWLLVGCGQRSPQCCDLPCPGEPMLCWWSPQLWGSGPAGRPSTPLLTTANLLTCPTAQPLLPPLALGPLVPLRWGAVLPRALACRGQVER